MYAVKVFDKKESSEPKKDIKSLKKEVEILRKLNCEKVCKFYEIHETSNKIWLVLEYLEGGHIFNSTNVCKYDLQATKQCIKSI